MLFVEKEESFFVEQEEEKSNHITLPKNQKSKSKQNQNKQKNVKQKTQDLPYTHLSPLAL